MFFIVIFIKLISSLKSVLVPVGGTATIDVGRYQVLVPLEYNSFHGYVITSQNQKFSLFGDEKYYILNFSVPSTLYIETLNNEEATFYYDIFNYESCSAIDIIINPENGYNVIIGTGENATVPMRNNQKLCLWMLWDPNFDYKFSLTNNGIDSGDKFSYSTDSQADYTLINSGTITLDSSQTKDVLRTTFQTDGNNINGYAEVRVSTSNSSNKLRPSLSNSICINDNPSGEIGNSCSWITFLRYPQILDIEPFEIPKPPSISTPFIISFCTVLLIIILVIIIICCRGKKCQRKVSGSTSSSSSSSSTAQRNDNQFELHTIHYNPNYSQPGMPENQTPYYSQPPMYAQYGQMSQNSTMPVYPSYPTTQSTDKQNQSDAKPENPYDPYSQVPYPNPYSTNN